MSADHKALLRHAAQLIDARKPGQRLGFGVCSALYRASKDDEVYHQCAGLISAIYFCDSPYRIRPFWMGPDFTPEQQQHRIMALLFAAEAYDDMEGV